MSSPVDPTSPFISFGNGTSLTRSDVEKITNPKSWLDDSILNAAFTIVQRDFQCAAHGVALLSCVDTQLCYNLRSADVHNSHLWYKEKLADKKLVILPINDGNMNEHHTYNNDYDYDYDNYSYNYDYTGSQDLCGYTSGEVGQGSHWSLVVVDCRGPTLRAQHFDSFCTSPDDITGNRVVADGTMHGLRHLLEANHRGPETEDVPVRRYTGYDFKLYVKTPHQVSDDGEDMGACGPFVWALASWFARRLCDGKAGLSIKTLARGKARFDKGKFKSAAVRRRIQRMIEEEQSKLMDGFGTVDYQDIGKTLEWCMKPWTRKR